MGRRERRVRRKQRLSGRRRDGEDEEGRGREREMERTKKEERDGREGEGERVATGAKDHISSGNESFILYYYSSFFSKRPTYYQSIFILQLYTHFELPKSFQILYISLVVYRYYINT